MDLIALAVPFFLIALPVEAQFPKKSSDLTSFQKFNPPLGTAMRRYLVWQFVVAAFSILWIGAVFAASGAKAVLLPCVMLWTATIVYILVSAAALRMAANSFDATAANIN